MVSPIIPDLQQIILPVKGMSGISCAVRIEKKIRELKGVHKAQVDFRTKLVTMMFDPINLAPAAILQAIENIGFNVPKKKLSFLVGGLSCASCVSRVEKKLAQIEGVIRVEVNLANRKATVEYLSGQMGLAIFQSLLEPMGFSVLQEGGQHWKPSSLESKDQKEHSQLKLKLIASVIIGIMILYGQVSNVISTFGLLLLATPIQFWAGWQFYSATFKGIRHGIVDMNTLISVGTSVAYLYSALSVLYPESITPSKQSIGVYFDTSVIIIALVLLGRFLEACAKDKTMDAIHKLIALQPNSAMVLVNDEEKEIALEEVRIGDTVCVRPGERFAVDGMILEGTTTVDESMITGESLPVDKKPEDKVVGGTINKTGFLKMRAERLGIDSVLGQIVKRVEEAQGSKAPVQRLADQVAGVFVTVVISLALLSFSVWCLWGSDFASLPISDFQFALTVFIAVMIIACPCALGLATPTAIMVGTGKGAEFGILIKGGEILEKIQNLDTIVFDKTGTLTEGKPRVTDFFISPDSKVSPEELLTLAASIERGSEHPLAQAVVEEAQSRGLRLRGFKNFEALPGFGVRAQIGDRCIGLVNLKWVKQEEIDLGLLGIRVEEMASQGKTPMILCEEKYAIGVFAVSDTLKPHAKDALETLKRLGLNVALLTGDHVQTAKAVAAELGIQDVIAEVLPKDKAGRLKQLQSEGHRVAMVGDGINDAPALAQADVGIALGTGTDIAMEASDITLIRGNLFNVADAIELSKKTVKTIRQNLFWAFFYNAIGIPIAAGVLYPFFGILLKPVYAAAAMSLSSVSVVTNSLLLKRFQPQTRN